MKNFQELFDGINAEKVKLLPVVGTVRPIRKGVVKKIVLIKSMVQISSSSAQAVGGLS